VGTAEVSLERLRKLRRRVDNLRESLSSDLATFLHEDGLTFRRKPDSRSLKGDVNVTTTCSCVMALALSDQFREFYHSESESRTDRAKAEELLSCLSRAPWMSSGLPTNNAFTTTLVLRTYGFLVQYIFADNNFSPVKRWDLELTINNPENLGKQLREQRTETTKMLYRSLSDDTRGLLDASTDHGGGSPDTKLSKSLKRDLSRIIHSGWIYHPKRFPRASLETQKALDTSSTSYQVAELNHQLLQEAFPREISPARELSFAEIAQSMAENVDNFQINDYPPAAAVIYWFVDGVCRSKVELGPTRLRKLLRFAGEDFNRQRSLVLASHDAMMDPVSLGMAACLCARLRLMCKQRSYGLDAGDSASLPSLQELQHSIKEVFGFQTDSGIWPKYFPMFHYQEAGSNFCFTFELLEAILHEFGDPASEWLNDSFVVDVFEKAVEWCQKSRLTHLIGTKTYSGWNSGGDLATLQKEKPESWATGVVHMFLWELWDALSREIQRRLLVKYEVEHSSSRKRVDGFDELLDVELSIQDKPQSLFMVLKEELIAANLKSDEADLRRKGIKRPISALLFGPPGSSKTRLAKAIGEAFGWPRLVINPSEFVRDSLENVYVRADEIFRDLDDLAAVVVFFDEMDALMQSREGSVLDTATQFITTSMLPKITQLHDKGKVVFLMATNYQGKFDPALKRAGRFDLLLCVGPPTLEEKLKNLRMFFPDMKLDNVQEIKAIQTIEQYALKNTMVFHQLEMFMFAEFKEFLKSIGGAAKIGDELHRLAREKFELKVRDFSKFTILSKDVPGRPSGQEFNIEEALLEEWNNKFAGNEHSPEARSAREIELWRYLRDRRESKRQY